jgi:hypothetical protein
MNNGQRGIQKYPDSAGAEIDNISWETQWKNNSPYEQKLP